MSFIKYEYPQAFFAKTALQYTYKQEGEWVGIRRRELKEMSGCEVRIVKLGTIWIWKNEN